VGNVVGKPDQRGNHQTDIPRSPASSRPSWRCRPRDAVPHGDEWGF
jgi:hypothetical protein